MRCGLVAVIRQDRWRGPIGAVLICAACLVPGQAGAEPVPAKAVRIGPLTAGGEAAVISESRALAAMWLLIREGRAGEAYQLGRIAASAHAGSAELRLALAFAAWANGNCTLALHHLGGLGGGRMTVVHRRRADRIRAQCGGPWRQEATVSLTAGYRQSLVDRTRLASMRLQPGSVLHGLCARLRGLCDPDNAFRLEGARASGIDIWTQLSLGHVYRDGGAWDFAVTPVLFMRSPRRRGYRGDGGILRLETRHHTDGGREVHILAETGASRFQQGDTGPAIAQTHRLLGIGLVLPHGNLFASRFGHRRDRVVSRWLDLRRRVSDYRLMADRGGTLSGWVRLAVERGSQRGRGLMPGSQARERGVGVGWRLPWMQVGLHHLRRTERFTGALPYLAAPHRAHTRRTAVTLAPDLGWTDNLKVVFSFEYRKILSADPYRPPSTKNASLTVSYKFTSVPFVGSNN